MDLPCEKYVSSTSLWRAGEPDPSLLLGRPHETDLVMVYGSV